MSQPVHALFLVSAPDQPGLVARLASFFYAGGLNIIDASNHTDIHAEGGARFFMRLVVDLAGLSTPAASKALRGSATRGALETAFGELSASISADWSVRYTDVVQRVAILVTKDPACLYDLVLRQRAGELNCEIPLIISNHPTLEPVAESFRIPFVCLPVTPETKQDQERRLLELAAQHHVDLVVLARYMQILTAGFLEAAPPVINIHHGFLPAFQGAKPYHQAHARGVKLIGATAHYATQDLDQGPIIEQDVARVTHALGPEELTRVGRDVERVVLSRAVRAHLERRVIVAGRRTIVL
ncbi:formyltetrahydrofolate deformylase [Chondromyces crocatus]|uniref:Formyltetrahydrofolate deformylase n=1 Tax=Chondromyces crocatus TaxID=52 RepID=A0A0K1E5D8_CHOCO|nr:formyltetrahydrofolate deformylase [Chondromyces crocatus]AKT36086.1 formyltetrahydrofolate deformylase [Chondromyces crocatus]